MGDETKTETLPATVKPTALRTPDPYDPATLAEAHQLALALFKSGLLPTEIKTAEAAFAILAKGHELGLKPMQSFDLICVIKGKPALSAAGMRALCLARPDVCEFFRNIETTPTKATFETKRRGDPSATKLTFTIDEAKRAGLVRPESNWTKWPERMLEARASSALARLVYPDLVGGIYTPEEIQEVAAAKGETTIIDAEIVETPKEEPVAYEPPAGVTNAGPDDAMNLKSLRKETEAIFTTLAEMGVSKNDLLGVREEVLGPNVKVAAAPLDKLTILYGRLLAMENQFAAKPPDSN
jgi:hypothetical protein